MADKPYWELLRDPRWQRKRLEIMERDGFRCQGCGAEDKTLNVHHGYYEKGLMPWEYPTETLHTLCEDCHKIAQKLLEDVRRMVGALNTGSILELIGYLSAIRLRRGYGAVRVVGADMRRGFTSGCGLPDYSLDDTFDSLGNLPITYTIVRKVYDEISTKEIKNKNPSERAQEQFPVDGILAGVVM